jgi:hypothetical protein
MDFRVRGNDEQRAKSLDSRQEHAGMTSESESRARSSEFRSREARERRAPTRFPESRIPNPGLTNAPPA